MLCQATACFFPARFNRFFLGVEGSENGSVLSFERVDPAPVDANGVHGNPSAIPPSANE